MPKGFWRIEGVDGTTISFMRDLPGFLTESEIIVILQRLACRLLTENEIVSASLRKNARTALLQPAISRRPRGKRLVISVSGAVDYIATYWRADEILRE